MQRRAAGTRTDRCQSAFRHFLRAARRLPVLLCFAWVLAPATAGEHHGRKFVAFTSFAAFEPAAEDRSILLSPEIQPGIAWDELIVSWNYRGGADDGLAIEARALRGDTETGWFRLGSWSPSSIHLPRESVPGQRDADGRVDTDVLKLKHPAESVRLRLTFSDAPEALQFLGLSFAHSQAAPAGVSPLRAAWGKSLDVPERSQASYPEGITEWCSPTSVSMVMSYWGRKLGRTDLDHDVPEVARAVNDPNWPGTGNWPFNTAFAGGHSGIRAYVTRFSDVSEIEQWVSAGVPVVASVSYGKLKGSTQPGNGHLVVCIGFTEEGEMITNDPGRSAVRQVYPRENFIRAWADSKNTVYLVYPENWKSPRDRFGHWFTPRE